MIEPKSSKEDLIGYILFLLVLVWLASGCAILGIPKGWKCVDVRRGADSVKTDNWRRVFYTAVNKERVPDLLHGLEIKKYVLRKRDCIERAMAAVLHVREKFLVWGLADGRKGGVAVFIAYQDLPRDTGHMLVMFVHPDGSRSYWEPVTKKEIINPKILGSWG